MNQQMDKQLPEGWETTQLAEVADIILGQSPDGKTVNSEGKGIVFYQGKAEFGLLHPTPRNYCTNPKKIAKENDILLSVRAPVGPTNLANQETAIGRGLAAIRETQITNFKFILFYFRNIEQWLSQQGTGTTFQAISGQFIRDLPFPLPPLAEQHYLADKLDSLLARIQTLSDQLAAVPALLKQFRQSVLADAVSGKLTAEWRSSQDIDKAWEKKKLSDIVTQIEAGKNIKCIETPPNHNEYGIVKISAVTWGVFDEAESKTLHKSKDFLENRRIKEGDFLISRANTLELVGSPVIVETISKNLMLSDKVLRLCMPEQDKKWVLIFMRSANGRAEIEKRATGNQLSMRNIGQKALLDIDLPKPSIAEQTEIVRRVETLFALADNIEQQSRAAAERVALLTQSVLAKAFRGELSEQWRREHPDLISGDNSAAALLARIQAERAATGKKSRRA